ncbi:MAG: alpha/beta hydrolase [Acidobacteria bacterium]|nr:alpha/beta hydrolase [Acidobacteriota bacterium]
MKWHATQPAVLAVSVLLLVLGGCAHAPKDAAAADTFVSSADGVEIGYTTRGAGDTTLVFIHGGLADRSFFAPQMDALGDRYALVALDLGGHGASGRGRTRWVIPAWGEDVRAVVEATGARRVVLIGNSLGGAVALEAAARLPGRVLGVVAVDTLHDMTQKVPESWSAARAKAFRDDFPGTCHALVDMLFHKDEQLELRAWAEQRMCATPVEIVAGMMEGFAGYDDAAAGRAAAVPIRAINGDLFPTKVDVNRAAGLDFDAVIMTGAGHYPMLERPAEFNAHLVEIVTSLEAGPARGSER